MQCRRKACSSAPHRHRPAAAFTACAVPMRPVPSYPRFCIIAQADNIGDSMKRIQVVAFFALLCLAIPIVGQMPQEKVDLDAIYKIKDEGLNRSQVMDTLSYLTDVYGARLTGSPQIKAAGEWAKKKLTEWELVNVNLETWGPFGRGWTNEKVTARAISPNGTFTVIAQPKAWTPGTNGSVEGDVVIALINNEQDFDKFRGQLRGKYVLISQPAEVAAQFQAPGRRYTDEELQNIAAQPVQPPRGGTGGQRGGGGG